MNILFAIAVVQVVATGKIKDRFLAACIHNVWLITAALDIDLRISHIKGSDNDVADLLSRLHSDTYVENSLYAWILENCTWDKVPIQCFNLDLSI